MDTAILDRLREVQAIAESRRRAAPDYEVYESICRQLDYLSAVASGQEHDRLRLREIVVGVYAIREFEDSDPELAVALKDAQFITDRMARGLKVSIDDLSR